MHKLRITVEKLNTENGETSVDVINANAMLVSYMTSEVGDNVDFDPDVKPNDNGEHVIGGLIGEMSENDIRDMVMQTLAVVGSVNPELFGDIISEIVSIQIDEAKERLAEMVQARGTFVAEDL